MIVSVPRETRPGERRVALVPDGVRALVAEGAHVRIQSGAGLAAGCTDADYEAVGAHLVKDAAPLLGGADLVVKVQAPTEEELGELHPGSCLSALMRPLDDPGLAAKLAERNITTLALELLPRITRAQSMDVLSSQATVAGYRAVVLGASRLPKMFPMLVTAAGTVSPARVFVIGAGVAGLQAISAARRLGGVVEAYDTREAAAEQVESLGGRFVTVDLDTGDSEDEGGYARAQTEEFYVRQREVMGAHAARSDVVILTALVPGQPAPLLLDEAGVSAMAPGSVVIDLAAANGGNCEVSRADEEVDHGGVLVLGPTNLPSDYPVHASQMFSKNMVTFVKHLIEEGALHLDLEDEITRQSLLTHEGKVTAERVLQKLQEGA